MKMRDWAIVTIIIAAIAVVIYALKGYIANLLPSTGGTPGGTGSKGVISLPVTVGLATFTSVTVQNGVVTVQGTVHPAAYATDIVQVVLGTQTEALLVIYDDVPSGNNTPFSGSCNLPSGQTNVFAATTLQVSIAGALAVYPQSNPQQIY